MLFLLDPFLCASSICVILGLRVVGLWLTKLNAQSQHSSTDFYLQDPTCPHKVPAPSIFAAASKSLSIIVPAYNEAERLPDMLSETLAYLTRRRDALGPTFTYEVLVVDDGSNDGTDRVVFGFIARHGFDTVRLLQLPGNKGKGYAVKRGMLSARGERLLLADADGATKVADLEKLEAAFVKLEASGRDQMRDAAMGDESAGCVVVGSRAHLARSAAASRPAYRNVLMHGFHLLVVLVAGSAVRDTQCGFKLFSRRAAAVLFSNMRLQRWCFDVELLLLAHMMNIPVEEVGVQWTEMPGSKIKPLSILHMAAELVALKIAYTFGLWKASNEFEVGKL